MRTKYSDLYFGLSDAVNEAKQDPDHFFRSYVNINNVVDEVTSGRRTFVFGPKGTGKSALGLWIASDVDSVCSQVRDAASLPLADIPNLQTGQPAGVERTVTAWKFILLCNYLTLLRRDNACSMTNAREVDRVTRLLREYGFMGDASGKALLKVATTTVAIPIPRAGSVYKKESKSALNIFSLIPYLEEWVSSARSPNRHVLFIDGLDSIYLNDPRYDESLAALVQAAYRMNQNLGAAGATGSVVLLLRNDVFSRVSLRLPDSQKMRDDLGVDLDWRILTGSAGRNAPLFKLVNDKASAAAEESVTVLDYFPAKIKVGNGNREIPTVQYLLNLTRHTPRDLLRLFEEIRKVEASNVLGQGSSQLSAAVIREGVVQYSTKYFVNAIKNEFAGYEGGPEIAQDAVTALQYLGSQKFDRIGFRQRLREVRGTQVSEQEGDRLLKLLFFAGAIGNLVGNDSYMRFYHRRDDSEIYLRGGLILHGTLCHAWNVPFAT
ncbi:P-loop ATPase, Sll1717 family [Antrihabitans spumae]|uniref:P-loop ATPase, Sll1717 family n=1 Tax=Antrihabitans spumae TaxID=3373370 RepID=A0ABW7JY68_9NOCA